MTCVPQAADGGGVRSRPAISLSKGGLQPAVLTVAACRLAVETGQVQAHELKLSRKPTTDVVRTQDVPAFRLLLLDLGLAGHAESTPKCLPRHHGIGPRREFPLEQAADALKLVRNLARVRQPGASV